MENQTKEQEIKDKMDKAGIEEIIKTEVKSFGTSAHITVSKKYIGKKAIIFILKEKK